MGLGIVSHLLPSTANGVLAIIVFVPLAFQAAIYIYNVFFHPLRKFPGPPLSAASTLPLILHAIRGNVVFWTVQQHEQYGEVVRISPNELSFSGADAYRDIYGHKKPGLPTLEKDPRFYKSPSGDSDIVNGNTEDHARQRRIFSHAFSDKALKLQEPLFLTYVDRLVQKLRDSVSANAGQPFNMVQMYNFTTFDVMGDLTFGEPLDMLADSSYHPWVAAMFAGFKYGVYLHAIRYFPLLEALLIKYCIPASTRAQMKLHKEFSVQRVNRRLEAKTVRPDIWGLVLKRGEQDGLTQNEMYSNANIFMIAGTETTATLLSGLTFYLLKNADKLEKLKNELRTSFKKEEEITIERLQGLPYLNACIEEGLRMYPPVSNGLPRMTPNAGQSTYVDGYKIPPGTTVFVTTLAANRNHGNWRDPHEFMPERWLSDAPESSLYANDKRHGFQPFSTGPRACLGKNMAYHEMRLILTKVLYNFDIFLCPESAAWSNQKIFIMWDKPPLWCQLRAARRP